MGMDYFAHYGVKGMKWGVRKDRQTTGGRKLGKAEAKVLRSKPVQKVGNALVKAHQQRSELKSNLKAEKAEKSKLKSNGKSAKTTALSKRKAAKAEKLKKQREDAAKYDRVVQDTDSYVREVIQPKLKAKYGDISSMSNSQRQKYANELDGLTLDYYNKRYRELFKTQRVE